MRSHVLVQTFGIHRKRLRPDRPETALTESGLGLTDRATAMLVMN